MSHTVVRLIDPVAADEAVASGAYLLDVREPHEFEAGHAPDAHSVPLGSLEPRRAELPRDVMIVCVCRSGGRSDAAAAALLAAGFDAVNLAGGMLAWAADGLPVTSLAGTGGAIL